MQRVTLLLQQRQKQIIGDCVYCLSKNTFLIVFNQWQKAFLNHTETNHQWFQVSCILILSEPLLPDLKPFSSTWNNPSYCSCAEEEKQFFCHNNEPSSRIMGPVLVRSTFCTRWRNADLLCLGAVGQLWCALTIRRGCSQGVVKRRGWVVKDHCTAPNYGRGNKQCFEVHVRLEKDSNRWIGEKLLWISPLWDKYKNIWSYLN